MLCRLGGAALFRGSRPSSNSGYPFWLLVLTFRSSRPAFCGRLTSPVSPCSTLASPVEKLYKLFFEENTLKYISLALALMLSGCASSGVVPLTADKFMISKNTVKFGGGISASAAAEVHEEANSFCTKQGKKVETVDLQLSPGRAGSAGSVTLQFRCI